MKNKKIAIITVSCLLVLMIAVGSWFYMNPKYAGVRIKRSQYNAIQNVVKQEATMMKLIKHPTDKNSYNAVKASKELTKEVKKLPDNYRTDQVHERAEELQGFYVESRTNVFTNLNDWRGYVWGSAMYFDFTGINDAYAKTIAKTDKVNTSTKATKIVDKMNKDAGMYSGNPRMKTY